MALQRGWTNQSNLTFGQNKTPSLWTVFFFFQFLFCSQTSYDSQEGLVKFDYGPNMKVEKFKNNFIFWLFSGTCSRNLAILFLIFEFGKLGASFKQKSIICVKIWNHENLPPKKTLAKFYHIFYVYKGISMKKLAQICQIFTKFFQIPRVLW